MIEVSLKLKELSGLGKPLSNTMEIEQVPPELQLTAEGPGSRAPCDQSSFLQKRNNPKCISTLSWPYT